MTPLAGGRIVLPGRRTRQGWQEHLDALGVEHSGILESSFGTHINFKDPDGIALEVHTPPRG